MGFKLKYVYLSIKLIAAKLSFCCVYMWEGDLFSEVWFQDLKSRFKSPSLAEFQPWQLAALSSKGPPRSQASSQICEQCFYNVEIKSLPWLFRVLNWKTRGSNNKDKGALKPLLLEDHLPGKCRDPSFPSSVEIILSGLHKKTHLYD